MLRDTTSRGLYDRVWPPHTPLTSVPIFELPVESTHRIPSSEFKFSQSLKDPGVSFVSPGLVEFVRGSLKVVAAPTYK